MNARSIDAVTELGIPAGIRNYESRFNARKAHFLQFLLEDLSNWKMESIL